MYKIGEFSKIVDIPVRTLRFYAESGVLIPSETDRFTGYKYYSDNDIIKCDQIKILKSLDFTLEEIIKYKDIINEEIIENKKEEIKEKIFLLKLKYKRLTIMQNEIKNNKVYSLSSESNKEKVLRRKYEKRIIGKNQKHT